MKILCFTQFFLPELGGMQVSNSLLVQGLRELGHEIELHILGRPAQTRKDGLFRQFDHPFSATDLLGHLRVARLVMHRCRELSPDMVLLLDESVVRALGMLPFKAAFGTRLVSVNSGSTATRRNSHLKGKLSAWFVRRGYRLLHKIFVADATASQLEKRLPYLAPRVRRLGRPIPSQFFIEPKDPPDWPSATGVPIFLSSGRASVDKGIHFVLQALAQLKEVYGAEKIEYWCIGGGPELESWRQLAQKLKLTKVLFFGYVDFFELHEYYAKADFFILPSKDETFGRVWVEAMASSKPVVSTQLNNLSNIVFDGKNGFLIQPNTDSVRMGIERCLSLTGDEYLRMSRMAYETASEYRLSCIVGELIDSVECFSSKYQS